MEKKFASRRRHPQLIVSNPFDPKAKSERMVSPYPGNVVIGLNGGPVEMEFRSRAQTAREGCDTRHGNFRSIMSGNGTERRVACRLISAREGESRCSHDTVDPESDRIENPRTEGMCFAHREELPPRIVSGQLVVQLVGLSDGSAVKHVSSRECVPFRESVIDPGREIIFRCDLLSRKRIDTGVPRSQKTPIGQ